MTLVISAEIVAGALILCALFALTFIFVRRRLLASGAPLMLCALQPHGRSQYRMGLLRFAGSSLEWFSLVGPSLRPSRTWERARLDLAAPVATDEQIAGVPDAVTVDCRYGADAFALALAPSAYTAMRSWLESSPPGFNVNVA
ncbi:DUF2550 family protein [Nostocoides sp. HKS02]|uniref:DUF2550 family protein n=1 Tax=Nostocoides sp. HKS02 TaxID=1813880 RepID=UPI0012B4BC05|nr:DUF2550 family protein [Tetrasphaera sp. HKS02]QGN57907.1 DUF2550 family protein [Tetrasphaera sp. HKS02]